MSILKIECGNESFFTNSEHCIKLEIKFNLTEYGGNVFLEIYCIIFQIIMR